MIAAVLVASAVFAACAKDSPTDPGAQGPGVTENPQVNVTRPTDGPPKPGGRITYALEAETDSGWNPTKGRWAISGTMVGLAIFDALSAVDDKGAVQPYLAKKFESNADFKVWTITLRDGVKFHDGTPLTGEAVKKVFDAHLQSGLTGPALRPIETVEVTGPLAVKVTMKTPWATFPGMLTSQLGVIPAPSQLDSGDQSSQNPVGTGPFKFVSWVQSDKLVTEKNKDYWRKDANGVQLPYLDQLTFQPVTDNSQRKAALDAGQLQMFHTSDGPSIKALREQAKQGKLQIVEDRGEQEEGSIMFNTSKPPFDNLNARLAVAYSTDRDAYVENLTEGVNEAADGVFSPNSLWYIDSKFPKFDLVKAREYADKYQQETGKPLEFTFGVGGPDSKKNGELLQQGWSQAGIKAQVNVVSQGSFIGEALQGNYEANLWRQFGAVDPDNDYIWWISDNAKGALTLNFARNQDPEIDKALNDGRGTLDIEKRKDAYARLQQRFTADVPYVWLDRSSWAIVAANDVRGIENGPLPDGQPSMPIGGTFFPGVHRLVQTWLATS